MASKRCPNCGLTNPGSAVRCDCGYDFPSGAIAESYANPSAPQYAKHDPMADVIIGGGLCLLGVALTVGTLAFASSGTGGGVYVVAWGPAIFGFIRLVRGLVGLASRR